MKQAAKYLVGIDEAGRGPLAGPVAVAAVVIKHDFDWSLIPGVTDSKKLSAEKRAEIFVLTKELRYHRHLNFSVAQVGPTVIDKHGITAAIDIAIKRCLNRLELNPQTAKVRLDGSLSAPKVYNQATIIKGDLLYPEIGLASIIAKETRDAYMKKIARRWSGYGFELHKGYGTKTHREIIRQRGLSPIHRASYCKNCF